MMVKVRMIRVAQVSTVRRRRRRRLLTPRKKAATKAFQRLISVGLDMLLARLLQQDHLVFEAEKDDQRHHQGEPHDEKGQDHHHGAVGQLKGRVDLVDDGDEQQQDRHEGDDPFVDVGVGKQQPLQAEGEGDEQGDVEQDAEEDVLLGFFHMVVDPAGQGPGAPRLLRRSGRRPVPSRAVSAACRASIPSCCSWRMRSL